MPILRERIFNRTAAGYNSVYCRIEGPVNTLRWNYTDEQRVAKLCLQQYLIPDVGEDVSPLLLKSVVQHWPALDTWTLQWLANEFPGRR